MRTDTQTMPRNHSYTLSETLTVYQGGVSSSLKSIDYGYYPLFPDFGEERMTVSCLHETLLTT